MKVGDIDYYSVLYNIEYKVPDDIAKLNFPQRYIRLVNDDGEIFDLDLVEISKNEILVKIMEKET